MGKEKNGTEMTRRTFLKATGAVAATASIGGKLEINRPVEVQAAAPVDLTNAQTFLNSCAVECLHHNMRAYVVDGKIVKVEGSGLDDSKPCLRGIARTQWNNHPDRLTMPLLRDGEKGEGKWREISWEEALDLVAVNIRKTQAELGNQGLLLASKTGNFGALTNPVAISFFHHLGGCTRLFGSLCCFAVAEAMVPLFGSRFEDTRATFKEAEYIIVWGTNPAVTMQSFFPDLLTAQANGAKMVMVDPVYNETAAKSDEWVPLLPGSDTAFALGMMKVIIDENRYDEEFILAHSSFPFLVDKAAGIPALLDEEDAASFMVLDGNTNSVVRHDTPNISPVLSVKGTAFESRYITQFDMLYEECLPWTPEAVAEESGIPADVTVRLAREYSATKKSMIIQNMGGFQRTEWGSYAVVAHCALAVLTGNVGAAGNGVCDAGGVLQVISSAPAIPSPTPPPGEFGTIPFPKFGAHIMEDLPNKIGFLWSQTTSLMTQYPNTNLVKEALKKIPFVVVVDNVMTSTALYADLVLPCTVKFESTNLLIHARSHYVQLMEKAVEPPGEARDELWMFTQLAIRMGFAEHFDRPVEELLRNVLAPSGITYEELMEKKCIIPEPLVGHIPYEGGNFRTATGKAHFFNYSWHNRGFKPIITYNRCKETVKGSPELAEKYPLACVQRKIRRMVHSSFGNLPWLDEVVYDEPQAMIHPDDARPRGISQGDWVILYNDRGEHRARANVTTHIKRGIVTAENGWWEQQGGSSSYIVDDLVEHLSRGGQCCNNTLIEVRKEEA